MARILFVHQNFPAQFKHIAPALVQRGHKVSAFCPAQRLPLFQTPAGTHHANPPTAGLAWWQGVQLWPYHLQRGSTPGVHPWLVDLESKTLRGQAVMHSALAWRAQGYQPDLIVVHPGWGESLFLHDVWPGTPCLLYAEYYYQAAGTEHQFDPEFCERELLPEPRLRLKNIHTELHHPNTTLAVCPSHWQASTFPAHWQNRLQVVHEGIDTQALTPNPQVGIDFKNAQGQAVHLSKGDEVVTFVARNLEPLRGYHVFMRSLPALLRARPKAQVLVVGGDGCSYGRPAPQGTSWRNVFAAELQQQLSPAEWQRVHFMGTLPYSTLVAVLQLSSVHVYLSYPFVVSWSLFEAMALGCTVVASNTAPLREVLSDGHNSRLVDFFDTQGLANTVADLLQKPEQARALGQAARQTVIDRYDLHAQCLPRWLQLVEGLIQPMQA